MKTAVVNKATAVYIISTAKYNIRTAKYIKLTAKYNKLTAIYIMRTDKFNKLTASFAQASAQVQAHLQFAGNHPTTEQPSRTKFYIW